MQISLKKLFNNKTIAIWVFINGIINIISVASPGVPQRIEFLLDFFPLNFLETTRFITLIIGLWLIIISVNIFRRKKRAYKITLLVLIFSVLFNLIKAIDYEEALISLILILILVKNRQLFYVKSAKFDLKALIIKMVFSVFALLLYGVLGFWFLEKKDLGINFNLIQALNATWKQIFLINNGFIPHTRSARTFLNSLNWLTTINLLYLSSALFKPLILKNRRAEHIRLAKQIIKQYSNSNLDAFKTDSDKNFFFSKEQTTVIAYGIYKNIALCLGDPVGPKSNLRQCLIEFKEYCNQHGLKIAFLQTRSIYLDIYRQLGFKEMKIGDEAIVNIKKFNLEGRIHKNLRNTISKLSKENFTTEFFSKALDKKLFNQLKVVSDSWLSLPAKKEYRFTLGNFNYNYLKNTPIFILRNSQQQIIAFVNLISSYRKKQLVVDLMRHMADVPNGTMDYLFVKLFLYLKKQGYHSVSLGLAPMSGFSIDENPKKIEKITHFISTKANFIFNFRGLKKYKAKFADIWEPHYLIYENNLDIINILRAHIALLSGKGE